VILSWKFLCKFYGEQAKKLLTVSCWSTIFLVLKDFVHGSLLMTLIELKMKKKIKKEQNCISSHK